MNKTNDECRAFPVGISRTHKFDEVSGWCVYGCGNRDDGRAVSRSGVILDSGVRRPNELDIEWGTE